jgi:hypothetical protein
MASDRRDGWSGTILGTLGLTITFTTTPEHDPRRCSQDYRRANFHLLSTAVRCAAAALQFPFCKTRVAVKSIFGAMGRPWNGPLWAEAPVNTAASPYLRTCVSSNVIDASLRSPDLSAAMTPALSNRLPLSSVSEYESTRIVSSASVSA